MLDDGSAIEDAPLQVVLEVPDRRNLVELLETVSNADLAVRTETITPAYPAEEASVTIDLDVLTEKQRDALELALEMGYYGRPREGDLEDIADKLQISKSAVSQRLRAAETKLVRNALERYR